MGNVYSCLHSSSNQVENSLSHGDSANDDIWIRKMKTYFRTLDLDEDGVISRRDFIRMAERFANLEKFPPVQKESARHNVSELFSLYTKAAATIEDVMLTEDLLIESVKMQKDDPAFRKGLHKALLSLFNGMDLNQDGHFSYDEFRRIFENLGLINVDFTKAAFAKIDTNYNGKISFEEYLNASYSYMCSDAKNSTELFGLHG